MAWMVIVQALCLSGAATLLAVTPAVSDEIAGGYPRAVGRAPGLRPAATQTSSATTHSRVCVMRVAASPIWPAIIPSRSLTSRHQPLARPLRRSARPEGGCPGERRLRCISIGLPGHQGPGDHSEGIHRDPLVPQAGPRFYAGRWQPERPHAHRCRQWILGWMAANDQLALGPDRLRRSAGRSLPRRSAPITGPVADRVWHHLAANGMARRCRCMSMGNLGPIREYTGADTPPTGGRLRIGYADSGVGSASLDVDEIAIYRRALKAQEILRDLYFYVHLSDQQLTQWSTGTEQSLSALLQSAAAPGHRGGRARSA